MQDLLTRARAGLRHEPVEKRVRAVAGGRSVVDTMRAALVWEPGRIVPSYAVPADELRVATAPAPAAGDGDAPELLHPGIPFAVHTASGEPLSVGGRPGSGFRLDDPDLAGYVLLDFDAFEWLEEDEPIAGHPRDPFHRIDVRQSAQAIRIELAGEVVAETTRARVLFETWLVPRYYIPPEDVRAQLHPGTRRTYCPYKGSASYWSLDVGGRRREHHGWTYAEPLPDAVAIAGLVAFWNEVVDVVVDGVPRERPSGPIADSMRAEFGV